MQCPICKKEFNEKTGRRPKKFCSDVCKVKWWNLQRAIKKEGDADKKLKEEVANDTEITKILEEINTSEPPKLSRIQELMKQAEQELNTKK